MAKKRKSVPEPEPESDSSSSSSSSSAEYEEIEEEIEVTESDSDSDSSSETESEPESDRGESMKLDGDEDEDDVDAIDLTDRDAIKRLVEPFSKEQLRALLAEAAMKNPKVLSNIASSAQSDPEHRKIFVHGLSFDAKTKDLEEAFTSFGPIEEVKAVCDRVTGRCKGYGFVLFQHRSSAQNALKEPQKRIGECLVSCQLASRGPQQKPRHGPGGGSVHQANVNIGSDIPQVGNFGLFGALNPLGGLGLLNQTGAPHTGTGPSNFQR